MKKQRTIKINNQCLKKLRNNLRLVLFEVYFKTLVNLDKLIDNLEYPEEIQDGDIPRFKGSKESRIIHKERDKLYWSFHHSICICSKCMNGNKNMTFSNYFKVWWCVDCFNKFHELWVKNREKLNKAFRE